MPTWFAIAAPYIPEIIKIARPLFTRNSSHEKSIEVVAQQIAELQTATIQNAESIKIIASEMQRTIDALQTAAAKLEAKLEKARKLLIVSSTVSVLAICLAAYALTR
jgi:hypothetical protein